MRFAMTVTILGVFATSSVLAAEPNASCKGLWSAGGRQPHVGDAYTADEIPSPNKEHVLSFTEDAVQFNHQGGKPIDIVIPINLSLMEVVWAPTSDAFAINVSDGDASGPWQMFVFRVDANNALRAIALDGVRKEANVLASCERNKSPNVVGVGWLPPENDLAIAVIVPESCRNPDKSSVLRVSTAGKTVEKLPLDEFKKRWPQSSGCRLQ
jgi:hypothetical protein